jgi:hypothetical protein
MTGQGKTPTKGRVDEADSVALYFIVLNIPNENLTEKSI